MKSYRRFRTFSLVLAESFDAWRIMPRLMLVAYAILVLNLYLWYKTIPTYVQEKCDAAVLQIFLNNKTPIDEAQKIACTVQDVVGGPTPAQTTLVTTIIGLTSIIFGFYTNSGRKWENGMPDDIKDKPTVVAAPPVVKPKPTGTIAPASSTATVAATVTIPGTSEVIMGPNGPIS